MKNAYFLMGAIATLLCLSMHTVHAANPPEKAPPEHGGGGAAVGKDESGGKKDLLEATQAFIQDSPSLEKTNLEDLRKLLKATLFNEKGREVKELLLEWAKRFSKDNISKESMENLSPETQRKLHSIRFLVGVR